MMNITLYRPVNLAELTLIQKSGWNAFPPRLFHQPIFYPVTNLDYARQITREWNLPTYGNGFVTSFKLPAEYLSQFKVETVGQDHHTELWVPSEKLEEFNNHIIGKIKVEEGYNKHPSKYYFYPENKAQIAGKPCIIGAFLDPDAKLGGLQSINNVSIKGIELVRALSKDETPRLNVICLILLRKQDLELIGLDTVSTLNVESLI